MAFEPTVHELTLTESSIQGLYVVSLPVHGDSRGWFKENWQKEKMTAIGLPDFGPVQNNISFNAETGVTRGLHAEPWDKYISVGSGSVYGAWCDLREGSATFGKTFTTIIDPSKAIYVPRGVANGFQALEDNTVYTYLVNDHWSADAQYANVSIFDESLTLDWPIPLETAIVSEKDMTHPLLVDAATIAPKKLLVLGANGQLGRALRRVFPEAEYADRSELDITADISTARRWKEYGTIINAAAYTAVDAAETPEGRKAAWRINASAVAQLAALATEHRMTLIHISSDYVFDGEAPDHGEDETVSPLSVYGASKAAGDCAAVTTPRHYILRTSWVIGEGANFVQTMKNLAERGISPQVVDDQIGRLTFTTTLADGIHHLLRTDAPFGTYNLTNSGDSASWATIAKEVYRLAGYDPASVSGVSTDVYFKDKPTPVAPRPRKSTLCLEKIQATGFKPEDWRDELAKYLTDDASQ